MDSRTGSDRLKSPCTWCTLFLGRSNDGKREIRRDVDEEIVGEVDELVAECDDLGASRSEIVEAILTAFVQSGSNHAKQVREIIIRKREGTL
jgi:hypothetical protein